jgi:CPA2 family monovalent cation:H+ antiporter-2
LLHIIARASTWAGARRLAESGVTEIVRPELEGGVEIVRRTLVSLEFPEPDVQRYTEIVRREDSTVSPPALGPPRNPSTIV